MRVKTLAFAVEGKPRNVSVTVNGRHVAAAHAFDKGRVKITLAADSIITAGKKVDVTVE